MQNNSQPRQQRPDTKEAACPPIPDKPLVGVVTDCVKLNIRKDSDLNAEVLTTISALSKVDVYPSDSTKDFYKIRTATGIDGFCMKKYIALRK